ncbi:hypothetical protein SARC_03840 [Sphaeroforma arctica JP610]|uniref:Uncharacterized protein n=1 Tax=Sphaeroforma arctica JP610 TaxID=667725 RepID=A0A0L0G4E0_9EUKA|nr:hypothetical protein SARC_03840 [Sphaeroforma arctica JP610]KNC83925.1 hypothetical protein SARC_03840 [Sphaeroforma arctica JP610]|eukprot:XP_014157827.1 hypothetical protein SARC_03840 [Sphaeroforma arctica JP610]
MKGVGWLHTIILAIKGKEKDDDYRLFQAYVGLNKWSICDQPNMPSEEHLRRHICNVWRCTVTDNANGFNQCTIDGEDRHKTRLLSRDVQVYERIDAGYGLVVVPAQYTQRNEYIFWDVEGFLSNVDGDATCTFKMIDQEDGSAATSRLPKRHRSDDSLRMDRSEDRFQRRQPRHEELHAYPDTSDVAIGGVVSGRVFAFGGEDCWIES